MYLSQWHINYNQADVDDRYYSCQHKINILYILPNAHIEIIIGWDILSQVGEVIDFTNKERSLLTTSGNKTADLINTVTIGYLGGITERTWDPINFASVHS